MAITFGTPDSNGGATTFAATCAVGSNLLLVGIVSNHASIRRTVSSVTYNGVAMTRVDAQIWGSFGNTELWYLLNPTADGVSHNVVITMSGTGANVMACAIDVSGVDGTTPLGTAVKASGTGTTVTVTASSAAGEVVVDCAGSPGDAGPSGFGYSAVGAGQTMIENTQSGTTASDALIGMSREAGAASVVMSWTQGAAKAYGTVAVPLKPAAVIESFPAGYLPNRRRSVNTLLRI